MSPDASRLASLISQETGLTFSGRTGIGADGERQLYFSPAGHEERHTFSIVAKLKFRRIEIDFQPGPFAGELLEAMSHADVASQLLFWTVVANCKDSGASVAIRIDDVPVAPSDPIGWKPHWRRFQATLQRNNLDIGAQTESSDEDILRPWLLKFSAAIAALLPLEPATAEAPNSEGLPEGAVLRVEVNRYERDRRNRAAALVIHGHTCAVCEMRFEEVYGEIGLGFIEVHHVTPVSKIGPDYMVNPSTDLIPLCSNCHSMAHRETPPVSVERLRTMVQKRS